MSFFKKLKDRLTKSSSKLEEGLEAIVEDGGEEIAAEAHRRWPLEASLIVHRVGRLEPGAPIVLVATASAHSQAAFESCQFLIDWLKTKAPFWKEEETGQGKRWVEARAADDAAAENWAQKNPAAGPKKA